MSRGCKTQLPLNNSIRLVQQCRVDCCPRPQQPKLMISSFCYLESKIQVSDLLTGKPFSMMHGKVIKRPKCRNLTGVLLKETIVSHIACQRREGSTLTVYLLRKRCYLPLTSSLKCTSVDDITFFPLNFLLLTVTH